MRINAALIVGKILFMAYYFGLPFSSVSCVSFFIALNTTP
jgi:hypothetical protein